jgi:hypothetical protein
VAPSRLRLAVPGTSSAAPQTPLVSLTTYAWGSPLLAAWYLPPVLQFRAEGHESGAIVAYPPWLRVPRPGTSSASSQSPFVSLMTKAW